MDKIIIIIRHLLYTHIEGQYQAQTIAFLVLVAIALLAVAGYYICKGFLKIIAIVIEKTPTKWDDDLFDDKIMKAISQLAPALIINRLLPEFLRANEMGYVHWISILTSFYILWAAVRIVTIFIGNLYSGMAKRKNTKPYAVKGIFQMLRLITIGMGIIIGISILIGKEPVAILTALGASAAILMLVFKDTILGLVASIQLTANKMLHKGDWIVAEKHGANGEVEDVSLTTVKIRNWDNSISTIPPYALVSESFRNYQPMRQSGARRVERSIYIDINTIRFLSDDELEALNNKGWLEGIPIEQASRHVNISLLRRYLEKYIARHKDINPNMLHMVRQMAPTQSGLPLNLYFFTRKTGWKDYERLQADIFDHVYAIIQEFGLRIFQTPAGIDLSSRNNSATKTLSK